MAYIAVSNSPIHVRQTAGPIDPGFGQGGDYPSHQPVPPGGPTDPGYGRPGWSPVDPGYGQGGGPTDPGFGVGLPPIASHPLPPSPGHPDIRPPTYPVRPGNELPRPPHMWPLPPRPENPDPGYDRPIPIRPDLPIYEIPPEVDNTLPMEPGTIYPPLPPEVTGKIVAFVWFVGIGWRFGVFDTSLEPTVPMAPPPLYLPGNELPETPEPK